MAMCYRSTWRSGLVSRSSDSGSISTWLAFTATRPGVLPIPAAYVIGRDGMVKARFVDPDFRRRMTIEDLLAALNNAR
jgi:hypothetical protein